MAIRSEYAREEGRHWQRAVRRALSLIANAGGGEIWPYILLAPVWIFGAVGVVRDIPNYHPGDMQALLDFAKDLLAWPPTTYYHNRLQEPWGYNHLPLFPILFAPWYWFFETVLKLPPPWAVKALIGIADLIIPIVLLRQARGPAARLWGLVLASIWLLSPWTMRGDHPMSVAVLFAMLAMATLDRPKLAGVMLGLAIGTRSEAAFVGLPLALHFAGRKEWRGGLAFCATSFATIVALALPFLLYDANAMDYALRRQIQQDASDVVSILSALLLPFMDQGAAAFLRSNPSFLALPFNGLLSLIALRDRDAARVAAICAVGFLITLPVMHGRYMLVAFGVTAFYAARCASPVAALLASLMMWEELGHDIDMYSLVLLFGMLVTSAVVFAERAPTAMTSSLGPYLARTVRREIVPLTIFVAVVAGSAAATALFIPGVASNFAPAWIQNRVAVNILTQAKRGQLALTVPPGADPTALIHTKYFTIDGDAREVLFMHPASAASLKFMVPDEARFRSAIGLDPQVWDKAGDGVEFQVEVRSKVDSKVLFSSYLDPKSNPSQRRWVEVSVDLSAYARQEVVLTLRTLPGSSGDFDWAGWGAPRVEGR